MSYLSDVTNIAIRKVSNTILINISQAFYDALVEYDREQANRIINTSLDPYFDKKNLGAFMEMLDDKGDSLTKIQT